MKEFRTQLHQEGNIDVYQLTTQANNGEFVHIYAERPELPVKLEIAFPEVNSNVDKPPYYNVAWPTSLSAQQAIELIDVQSQGQEDPLYVSNLTGRREDKPHIVQSLDNAIGPDLKWLQAEFADTTIIWSQRATTFQMPRKAEIVVKSTNLPDSEMCRAVANHSVAEIKRLDMQNTLRGLSRVVIEYTYAKPI